MKDQLFKRTGHDFKYWIATVQDLIAKHSTPPRKRGKYKGHGMTNEKWIHELVKVVRKNRPKGKAYDGNMWIASTLGMILVGWYLRVHRAKSYDPNRPVKLRKKALEQWWKYSAEMFRLITDESKDPIYFPGQKWDPPYSPDAKNGKFI